VVVLGIDDQALQQRIDLRGDFLGQRLDLARLDELRDVVVGAEALAGRKEARPDPSEASAWILSR
jgi:hypothetical protein